MQRIVVRVAAAALVAAAAGLGAVTPAQASTCATSHGVTVVVDFHQLGGGVQAACDVSGAGRTAITQLTDVGHTLDYVQRQPGFVCRIDHAPSSDPCVNTPPSDAYWSLWWSDGRSGSWTYASTGAGGLKVPDGGYVAMSWQGGDAKAPPRAAPKPHPSASPSPTRPPSSAPTHHASSAPPGAPSSAPSTSSSSASSTSSAAGGPGGPTHPPHAQAHASQKQKQKQKQKPQPSQQSRSAHADGSLDTSAAPASASTSGADGGLPGWVAPVVVLLLFAAAGTVVVVRRRGHGGT